jgi:hypothetical protein
LTCDAGLIPTPNGKFCIQKLDFCLDSALKDQPVGLTPKTPVSWNCSHCATGYFFDGVICDTCEIPFCTACSN